MRYRKAVILIKFLRSLQELKVKLKRKQRKKGRTYKPFITGLSIIQKETLLLYRTYVNSPRRTSSDTVDLDHTSDWFFAFVAFDASLVLFFDNLQEPNLHGSASINC